jgi:hypothetical protein
MALAFIKKQIDDTKAEIGKIHFKPEILDDKPKEEGIKVDKSVINNKPECKQGEIPKLYVNPKTNEFWYETVNRPLKKDERLEILEEKIGNIEGKINDVINKLDKIS